MTNQRKVWQVITCCTDIPYIFNCRSEDDMIVLKQFVDGQGCNYGRCSPANHRIFVGKRTEAENVKDNDNDETS